MSHYVYAPAFGALPVRAPQTKEQRNAAALEQARRATPAQKREALKNNRATANAEFAKQGVGNFVEVLASGELKLKSPFSLLDDFGRRMLNQQLPVLSVDANGKVSSKGVAPGTQIVDSMPVLNAEQKRQLKAAPFSFFAGIIDPFIDNVFGVAVQNVMDAGMMPAQRAAKTAKDTGELLKGGYVYDLTTFPFNLAAIPVQAIGIDLSKVNLKEVNIALEQPGDELFEPVSRRQLKSIRTALAFFVLYFKKWVELHAALFRALFPEEQVVLQKTTGTEENTLDTPYVVDRIPNAKDALALTLAGAGNWFERTTNKKGQAVFRVQTPAATGRGTSRYYTLSPKGRLDRAVEMQRQWDAKYEAYKNDQITNAVGFVVYGPRMTFLRNQGKTEAQARNIIASEDNFPKRFAEARNLLTQFRVLFDRPDLGGGLDDVNGPRPSDAFINRLKAEYEADLAARVRAAEADAAMRSISVPATSASVPTSLLSTQPRVQIGSLAGNYVSSSGLGATGAEAPAAGAAAEGFVLTEGAQLALIISGSILGGLMVVGAVALGITAMALGYEPDVGFDIDILQGKFGFVFGAKKVKEEPSKPPVPATPPAPPSDDPRLGARGEPGGGTGPGPGTSSEEGFPVVPVAIAAGLALFLLARR